MFNEVTERECEIFFVMDNLTGFISRYPFLKCCVTWLL